MTSETEPTKKEQEEALAAQAALTRDMKQAMYLAANASPSFYVLTKDGYPAASFQLDEENVPKDVPVLLEQSETKPASTNDNISTNELKAAQTATDVTSIAGGTVYVLYQDAFVKTTSGTIPAGKAYLVLAAGKQAPQRLSISRDGDSTGIFELQTAGGDGSENWYDLQGRKLQQRPTQKGVFIVNGKKVYNK
mgnify:CR=1 FL=1